MITDEKRREVAKKLREQAESSCFTLMQWWDHLQLTVMGKVYLTAPEKVYLAIADLIDRPIGVAFIPDAMEGYVFCPRCGAEIGEYGVPNYCHNCGLAITNGY